jgi:hypothetical protein
VKVRGSWAAAGIAALAGVLLVVFWPRVVVGARIVGMKLGSPKSVAERVDEHGARVRARMEPAFAAVRLAWPPRRVLLVAFKEERRLDLYALDSADGNETGMRRVKSYRVLAASGAVGPKLRAGDRQVPEGLYPIESLNPMSKFHLALRVGYPNALDRARAIEDGRVDLGGDIMVHGSDASIGCLAMGDDAAEDLFVIAALAGIENVSILIAPCDLRSRPDALRPDGAPTWTAALWESIRVELAALPRD